MFRLLLSISLICAQDALVLNNRLVGPYKCRLNSQLCMVDDNLGEDLRILETQFSALTDNKGKLSYKQFFAWDEVQSLIAEDLFEKDEFKDIWEEVVGDTKKTCSLDQFIEINRLIDEEFDEDEELDLNEMTIGSNDLNKESLSTIRTISYDDESDITHDVWSDEFKPQSILDPEFLGYLKTYFDQHAKDNTIGYTDFTQWKDIKDLLEEGNIDVQVLDDLWIECFEKRSYLTSGPNGLTKQESITKLKEYKTKSIDYDTFLRVNIRLNDIIEEIDEAISSLDDADYEEYYRDEFKALIGEYSDEDDDNEEEEEEEEEKKEDEESSKAVSSSSDSDSDSNTEKESNNTALLSFKELLTWGDLKEAMKEANLKKQDIQEIWNQLKLKPFIKKTKTGGKSGIKKGFGKVVAKEIDMYGIDENEFINFNFLLDELLQAKIPPAPVDMDPIDG